MKFKNFVANNIWKIIILAIVFSVGTFYLRKDNTDSGLPTRVIQKSEFSRTVSIAGKVVPSRDVDLGFDTSGRIDSVNVRVGSSVSAGQTLASLSLGDATAEIAKAEADLSAERQRLSELKTGAKGVSGTEYLTAQTELVQAIGDAYVRADDAIHNNVDQFFEADKYKIVFAFDDYELKQSIDKDRSDIERMLRNWSDNLGINDVVLTEGNLLLTKLFLNKVSIAVNDFEIEGSSYTQIQIDKFRADVSAARSSINIAIASITEAKDKLRDVESEVPYQEAKVSAAEAVVAGLKSNLEKRIITAPFSGTVTVQDAEVGEIVSSADRLIKLISSNAFQIETFVPEINIGDIRVGNLAQVTLDAFGSDVLFDVRVVSIDPAETLRDGVSTYKVTFEFVLKDSRLKSGLTANVIVTTEVKHDSILIPQSAVTERGGFSYVNIKVGEEIVEKQITTGSVATSGEIEVIGGLTEGEMLIIDPIIEN